MKRTLLFLTTIILTLAGCTSEEYVGDPSLHEANDTPPIQFDGGTEVITRAASNTSNTGTTPHKLGYQFKLYGVKSGATAGQNMQKVFMDYIAWYADNTANTTTSNSSGWEYVGDKDQTYGTGNVELLADQTIKYWDYSAKDYRFVAGSPVSAFEYTINSTTEPNTIETATIKGLAGHLEANATGTALTTNPVYVAKPQIVGPDHYKEAVTFEFVRQQAQVRVGIYETIPGYIISDIHFYTQDGTKSSNNNVILTSGTSGYFVGGTDGNGLGTIKYDWTTSPPTYTYTYDTEGESATVSSAQNWYGGAFVGSTEKRSSTAAIKATSSNEAIVSNLFGTDKDMDTRGFFTVLPTPSTTVAAPLLIKCDYTLKSTRDESFETIDVKGATAAIPAAFTKWMPNTMYTYLFKISDNTNGYTGEATQLGGLYPITFAATAIASGSMGTTTIVSTPSITTYQEGSVVDQEADDTVVPPVEAFHGIKYVTGKTIYATVAESDPESGNLGNLLELTQTEDANGYVAVYKLAEAKTEADLQGTTPTGTPMTIEIGNSAEDLENGSVTLLASKYLKFTPSTTGYYAIQHLTVPSEGPSFYTYKVVYVE